MRKVLFYSILLVAGLLGSQFLPAGPQTLRTGLDLAAMFCLSFIMIHVGYEFELDKSRPRRYAWDYAVAASAAALPWLFCTLYFVYVMSPPQAWHSMEQWRQSLLQGLFAAPTSAGVLFSMLAAAGLAATWVFKKARILAIFDDLQTILLLIPLKAIIIGPRWQLLVIAVVIFALLYVAIRYLNTLPLPITWPWVMFYSVLVVGGSALIHWLSLKVDPAVPIHLEVLLPAFAVGCVLKTPAGQDPHIDDAVEGAEEGPELPREQQVSTVVSAVFMVLVGLSMPAIRGGIGDQFPGWGIIALHVLAVTFLSNLGKMVPAFCYRHEAGWRQRLALAIGMFPRGEVGAGVLAIAISYNLAGPALTVAVLSLTVNLLATGLFILAVKKLIRTSIIPLASTKGSS